MNKVDWIVAEHLRQTREPTYTRLVDGVPCMTVTEHKHILAAARVAALEEAAKVCDRTASDYQGLFAEDESLYIAATDCAKEIRALIGKEST